MVKSCFSGNFFNNFWGVINFSLWSINVKTWVEIPVGAVKDKNESLGILDVELYNLIFFGLPSILFFIKYEPVSSPTKGSPLGW